MSPTVRNGFLVLAAALVAGCSSGGNNASSMLPSQTASSATRAVSSHGSNNTPTPSPTPAPTTIIKASAASLTFASASAPAQTITFTSSSSHGDDCSSIDVTVSAPGIVKVERVNNDDNDNRGDDRGYGDAYGYGDSRGNDDNDKTQGSATYRVTPLAAGTVNIVATAGRGGSVSVPVTVGQVKATPPPGPAVSVSAATVNCSTNTCGTQGIALIGPFVAKLLLPSDTLTITSSTATSDTVTSSDGNCGIVGATSPATIAVTPPSTAVTVGLSSAGYQAAFNSVSGIGTVSVPCAFAIANAGGTTTVSLTYLLKFPL